jgi:regulator of sigma E protease
MEIVIKISQFLLSLCILILLHELGHFMFAKIFKTRVEKFYLFFNPWFSLFKFKKGDTTYGIGWLPIGGYCKISGMIDESMDTKMLKEPPQPWEFRSKPAWQRLLIIGGGVMMNFILALLLYIMVLFVWGKEYLPVENATYGISVDSLAYETGFRNGDKILTVDNKPVETFGDVIHDMVLGDAKTVQVLRNNQKTDIAMPAWLIDRLIKSDKGTFIAPRFPFIISEVKNKSAAQQAGLTKDDMIIGINKDTTAFFDEFKTRIVQYKNKDVSVQVKRGKDTLSLNVRVPETGLLGIYPAGLDRFFKLKKHTYTFWQSIPAGIGEGFSTLGMYISQFKLIFRHKGYESLGSFISFTRIFPNQWDWQAFFTLTAFLSIILAFMNILPIPALDGGFILFILYEIILRKKPSDKFLEYAQMTGMALLLGLLLYATFNDIVRFVIK